MKGREGRPGTVYIVGAGPGDGDLITVRGLETLRKADVVVYDYLANPSLLEQCRPDCERIYVGKKAGRHSLPQERINSLLVERAVRGQEVVRLKGGDPFVFGRGGEEALELARNRIPFVVVPGITAAVAAAAYAGIPLTHRGLASSAALVTGHEDPTKAESEVDWERLALGAGTLAVYMGVKNLRPVVDKVLAAGRAASTPSALIRWGTLNRQQTLSGELGQIAALAEQRGFGPPAILVVGEVVGLRKELRWFDMRPLFGRTVVVTRSRSQASGLSKALQELGAVVREMPSICIEPLHDLSALDSSLARLASFSWIVFTSANGVEIFFSRMWSAGLDARALSGLKVAAIGAETAGRLQEAGIRSDLVPERFTSESLLARFAALKKEYTGERFLFPGSEIAGEPLPAGLEQMGAEVVRLPVYRNLRPDYSAEEVEAVFEETPDLVTFTSSSTVDHLVEALRSCGRESYLKEIRGACIGPVTAEAARRQGIRVQVEASPHTIAALVRAIEDYFRTGETT
jgi:uroporphyrinogen III methyltransferase/synthase